MRQRHAEGVGPRNDGLGTHRIGSMPPLTNPPEAQADSQNGVVHGAADIYEGRKQVDLGERVKTIKKRREMKQKKQDALDNDSGYRLLIEKN